MTDVAEGSPPRANPFEGLTRGVCRECGVEVAKNRFYCDEHRPLKKDKQPKRAKSKGSPANAGTRAPRGTSKAAQMNELEARIFVLYGLAADLWTMRDPVCGPALKAQAQECAAAWVEQAKTSKWVEKGLMTVSTGSGPVALIMAHLPIVIAVRAHHVDGPRLRKQWDEADDETRAQWAQAVMAGQAPAPPGVDFEPVPTEPNPFEAGAPVDDGASIAFG